MSHLYPGTKATYPVHQDNDLEETVQDFRVMPRRHGTVCDEHPRVTRDECLGVDWDNPAQSDPEPDVTSWTQETQV